jgi:two-component system, cell cycle sensor histidine kinase and response regulator CckA
MSANPRSDSEAVSPHARPLRALVLDDSAVDAELMLATLRRGGYSVQFESADSPSKLRERIEDGPWDVILTDFNMRTWTAFDALDVLKQSGRDIPLVVVTGTLMDEAAVELLKRGAADYVLKDRMARLPSAVERVRRESSSREGRRKAEEELRKSEEQYRLLFESNPHPMWVFDRGTLAFLAVNEAAIAFYGYSRDEFAKMTIQDIRPAEDVHRLLDDVAQQHAGLDQAGQWKHLTKDGRLMDVEVTSHRIVFDHKDAVLVLAIDITARKQAEASLVRIRQAVDASGEAVLMTDPEEVITFINPEFTRLYGYTEAEIVGKTTPRILKSNKVPPQEYARLWQTLLEKRTFRWEIVNRTKAGRDVTVESSVSPILDDRGNTAGYLEIQRDITERKKLEQQFRQAQKMEAVGRLAGGIAHDFNNLLTVINGFSDLLLSEERLDADQRSRVEEIRKAGDRAAALTRQLLAFSRQQVLQPEVLDLNHVIANSGKMLERLIGEDVEMAVIQGKDLWRVRADPGQIEQVIMNLAVNARDAMPEGGKLTLETANIELDPARASAHMMGRAGPYVMLAVSDTGHGMDAQTLTRIFEPFFTTKEKGKGTGLGLATVYGIIKQSGGSIWVYSEPGRGSTFKIYLPAVEEGKPFCGPPVSLTEQKRHRGGSETVLVVEDEKAVRSFARGVLESKGYRVLEAASGDDALRLAAETPPPIEILLTDLVMPGMSGRELARRLAEIHPETKCLFMSGYTDEAVLRNGGLGADHAFLQKPFIPESLSRKVREVLDAA